MNLWPKPITRNALQAKQWVKTFEKLEHEDYTDEWGLFLRKP